MVHIPTIGFMRDWTRITYLCDISPDSLTHCASSVGGTTPKTTTEPKELCSSSEVDLVLVASSDEYHAVYTILGLEAGKHVFVEKPMALSLQDADAIIETEKKSTGKVMVGYMRRFAGGFLAAVKEIGGIDEVLYARVRGLFDHHLTQVEQKAPQLTIL